MFLVYQKSALPIIITAKYAIASLVNKSNKMKDATAATLKQINTKHKIG